MTVQRLSIAFPLVVLLSLDCTDNTPTGDSSGASLPGQPSLIVPDSSDTGSYTVSWTSSVRAKSYTLEEDEDTTFPGPLIAYSGVDTSVSLTGKPSGRVFYYRVKANNDQGSGPWSPTKSVTVVQNPLTVSSASLNIVPGTSRTVQISGGTPPYSVISVDPPLPQIVTFSWEDSTVSPANLVITVSLSATINDSVVVFVGDANATTIDYVSITVKVVAVGDISYSDDIQPIWDGNCVNRGCHPGGGAPFSFERFVSYNNLYYFPVSNTSCGVVYRVMPYYPDSSLVYLLVSGRTSCPREPFSPFNPGDTLSLSDQFKIRDWIAQGARND